MGQLKLLRWKDAPPFANLRALDVNMWQSNLWPNNVSMCNNEDIVESAQTLAVPASLILHCRPAIPLPCRQGNTWPFDSPLKRCIAWPWCPHAHLLCAAVARLRFTSAVSFASQASVHVRFHWWLAAFATPGAAISIATCCSVLPSTDRVVSARLSYRHSLGHVASGNGLAAGIVLQKLWKDAVALHINGTADADPPDLISAPCCAEFEVRPAGQAARPTAHCMLPVPCAHYTFTS